MILMYHMGYAARVMSRLGKPRGYHHHAMKAMKKRDRITFLCGHGSPVFPALHYSQARLDELEQQRCALCAYVEKVKAVDCQCPRHKGERGEL